MTENLPPLPEWCEPGGPIGKCIQAYALQAIEEHDAVATDLIDGSCNHGSLFLVHDCLRCGAPVCCGRCCSNEQNEDEQAFEGRLAYELTRHLVIDISTARYAVDEAMKSCKLANHAREALKAQAAEIERLRADAVKPSGKETPGPWFVRKLERDGELVDCFIAAPDCNGFAFDAQILGDDEYHHRPDGLQRQLADCELIVAAVNAAMRQGEEE